MNKDPTIFDHLLKDDAEPACAPLGAVLACVSIGEFDLLEALINSALDKGVHPSHIHEILLQAHLFAGFPRAITGLMVFARIAEEKGLDASTFLNTEKEESGMSRAEKGKRLFDRVYEKNAEPVLESLHSLHPQYDKWVLEDAYGRLLSRSFLDGKTRQLCAVAALPTTGVPTQLHSHIVGALNLGADKNEVREIIVSMEPLAEKTKIKEALDILAKMGLK